MSTSTESRSTMSSKQVAAGILGTSFIGTIALMSPFVVMQLKSPLPYMATPRRKIINALEFIKAQHHQQGILSKPRYFDLGSGDGETVLAASSMNWRATGFELNSTLYLISQARWLMTPHAIRKNCDFKFGDMWKQNIGEADAVMIFGVKPLMPKIAHKIQSECRPGTFVLSYRFHIPIKIPSDYQSMEGDEVTDGFLNADLVFDEEEMRVYRLRRNDVDAETP
jgi:hypothetical protein